MLDDFDCQGKHLGIELHAYGLTAQLWDRIQPTLSGYCRLQDVSDLVTILRVIKSPAEIRYVERAAELADDALDEAIRLAAPGVFEGEILAAMHGAIYRGGGDDPANEFIIGSGEKRIALPLSHRTPSPFRKRSTDIGIRRCLSPLSCLPDADHIGRSA